MTRLAGALRRRAAPRRGRRARQTVRLGRIETLESRTLLSAAPLDADLQADYLTPMIDASGHAYYRDPIPDAWPSATDTPQGGDGGQEVKTLPFPLEQTFLLHSNPGATKVIYLDFDGHSTTGTSWNSGDRPDPIITPMFSLDSNQTAFSDVEQERIQRLWARVAEDYLPFDVDVTTEDPGVNGLRRSGWQDTTWGVRVAIGGSSSDWLGDEAGGIAYQDSFDWNTDTPAFIFENDLANGNEKYTAEAISHEVGHTLSLSHDGDGTTEYYEGHGSGTTSWAPIMGLSYYNTVTQWSKGEYPGANRTEDDLALITTRNGFGYRNDDHSNTRSGATSVAITQSLEFVSEGIIERASDVDYFVFTTQRATLQLQIDPAEASPNLDVLVQLYDASGAVVASDNPADRLDAGLDLLLPEGTYFLSIEGVGKEPTATGYTDYGSLGYYSITAAVEPAPLAEVTGRYVFYNQSAFDGNSPTANALDANAVATDKQALLPGQTAAWNNYTSYSQGINGILVDIDSLPGTPTAADFTFRTGNSNDPGSWAVAPSPSIVLVRPGQGQGGADRVHLVWGAAAVTGQWLQVSVLATANTGLDRADVFYFGNAVGEGGDSATDAKVNATDMLLARNNPRSFLNPAEIDFPYDYNRDARVNATDMLLARNNPTNFLSALKLITVPGGEQGAPPAEQRLPPPADAAGDSANSPRDDLAWLEQLDAQSESRSSAASDTVSADTKGSASLARFLAAAWR